MTNGKEHVVIRVGALSMRATGRAAAVAKTAVAGAVRRHTLCVYHLLSNIVNYRLYSQGARSFASADDLSSRAIDLRAATMTPHDLFIRNGGS